MKNLFGFLTMVVFLVAACSQKGQSPSTSSFDINLTPATPTESVIDLIIPRHEDMPQPDIYSGGDANLIESIGGVTQQVPATPRGYNIYGYYDGASLWIYTDFEKAIMIVSVNNIPHNVETKNGWQVVSAVAVGDMVDIHGLKQFQITEIGYTAAIEYYKSFNAVATPNPPNTTGGLFGSAKNDEFGVPKSFLPVPIQVGTESINTYNSGDQDCSVAKSAEGFVMTTPSSTTTVKLIRRDEIGLSVKYPVVEFNQGYSGDQYDGAWFVFRSELIQNRYVVSLQCYRQGLLLAEGNISTSPGMLIGMSGTINPNYSIYIEY